MHPSLLLPTAADATPPRRIPVAPKTVNGRVRGLDGREYAYDAQELAAVLNAAGVVTLDINHSEVYAAPEGRPSPAQARLTSFEVVDGTVYGIAEWTPGGLETWKQGGYAGLSPTFYVDGARVTGMHSVALVNNPNLALPLALNSATGSKKETMTPEEIKAIIADALKPTTDAVAAFDAKLAALSAQGAATTAKIDSLETNLIKVGADSKTAEANAFVESGITAGKLGRTEDQRAFWRDVFLANPEAARKQLDAMPALAPNGRQDTGKGAKSTESPELTPAELQMCKQLGKDPKTYKPRRLANAG